MKQIYGCVALRCILHRQCPAHINMPLQQVSSSKSTSLGRASSTCLQLQIRQPGQLRQAGGNAAAESIPMQVHLYKSGPIPAAGDAACEPVQAQVQNLQLLCLGQICTQLWPFHPPHNSAG